MRGTLLGRLESGQWIAPNIDPIVAKAAGRVETASGNRIGPQDSS